MLYSMGNNYSVGDTLKITVLGEEFEYTVCGLAHWYILYSYGYIRRFQRSRFSGKFLKFILRKQKRHHIAIVGTDHCTVKESAYSVFNVFCAPFSFEYNSGELSQLGVILEKEDALLRGAVCPLALRMFARASNIFLLKFPPILPPHFRQEVRQFPVPFFVARSVFSQFAFTHNNSVL